MLDVLILEDDESSRDSLRDWFASQGLDCRVAADLAQARALVDERRPDLAVLDLELPDGTSLELLGELAAGPTEVVLASGRGTLDAAITALRLGARDFLTKPVDLTRLEAIVRSAVQAAELRAEVASLRGELRSFGRFGDMLGSSPPMQAVYDLLERVAPTRETVFLTGPTGAGKEVTATTIHKLSTRASKPFVPVNCGAIASSLVEAELFGHERGAFTGAERRRKGLFEQAHGGTLFLDEVTEMDLELQVKLLRVLETGQLTRLGGSEPITVDVRVLAATNRDPDAAVAAGQLRQDLMYRLMVFPVELPPLSARGEDVLLLARRFLALINTETETCKLLEPSAEQALLAHDWPGNVRELSNVIRRAHLLADTHISAAQLPFEHRVAAAASPAGAPPSDTGAADQGLTMRPGETVREVEKRLIRATMEHCDGNKTRCAETLGISLKTLYARLNLYAAEDGAG